MAKKIENTITITQGDCLEKMQQIKNGSIDMILTDPPYGTTACKWDAVIPLKSMWKQLNRVIKSNGAIVINSSQPFTSVLIMSNSKQFKYCWYWKKEKGTGFATSGKRPLNIVEDICVFYQNQPFYDKQGEKLDKPYRHTLPISKSKSGGKDNFTNIDFEGNRKYVEYTHKTKTSFLKFVRDHGNKGLHPTQKPVALMEYLIKTYTKKNETVLDFAMGSGTTGVACKNLNRNFVGIELDKEYFKIAKNRIGKNGKKD